MVLLKTMGQVYNITKYVDTPKTYNLGLIGLKDVANLRLTFNKNDDLGVLDISKRIPINSIVEMDTIYGKLVYLVETPEVNDNGLGFYEHTLKLTEPKWLLEDRTIPDTTITQPIDVKVSYVREISRVLTDTFVAVTAGGYDNHVDFAITQVSNDVDIIDGRKVYQDGTYNINFGITFGRVNGFPLPYITSLTVIIYAGDRELIKRRFGPYNSWQTVGTIAFDDDVELKAGDEIKVVINVWGVDAWLNNKSGYLTISKSEQKETHQIYMDQVVDKLLRLVNVSDDAEFILDETSRARLSNILAFDDIHTEATLSTALERIASYVKARLRVNISSGTKIIKFDFYDDMSKQDYVGGNDDAKLTVAPSNDAISAVALQNNNVIRDSVLVEKLSIRSIVGDTTQLTTDNIGVNLGFDIDRIKSVKVKGKQFVDVGGQVLLDADTYIDITMHVLEKPYYDTLDKMVDYSMRHIDTQGNHIYFVRGDNKLYGMGNIGANYETFIPEKQNRAIYELIASVLERETGKTVKKINDGGLKDDLKLEFLVEYYPMSSSHAVILKDDQGGFQEKRIRRLNANDRVNNADYLGNYARSKVNNMGGTQHSIVRTVKKGDADLIQLGTVSPDNQRVVNITVKDYDNYAIIYATLVKDYVFQSMYVGIDSDRRLMHIPKDQYVMRVDKSLNVIYLNDEGLTYNSSAILPELFLNTLNSQKNAKKAPKSVLFNFDDKEITKTIDVGATANTIEWFAKMDDNYSAGNRLVKNDDEGFYYQYGVPYSNLFGNVNSVRVRFRDDIVDSLEAKNNIPLGNYTIGDNYTDFTYPLNKDAREQYALSVQTSIISANNNIMVYNGIGKYNTMANNDYYDIDLAILHYKPNLDDKYIDFGRITPNVNNAIINNGVISVNLSGSGDGFAFYERETGELLLAVSKNVKSGIHRIYYMAMPYNVGGLLTYYVESYPVVNKVDYTTNESISLKGSITSRLEYKVAEGYTLNSYYMANLEYATNDTISLKGSLTSGIGYKVANRHKLDSIINHNIEYNTFKALELKGGINSSLKYKTPLRTNFKHNVVVNADTVIGESLKAFNNVYGGLDIKSFNGVLKEGVFPNSSSDPFPIDTDYIEQYSHKIKEVYINGFRSQFYDTGVDILEIYYNGETIIVWATGDWKYTGNYSDIRNKTIEMVFDI